MGHLDTEVIDVQDFKATNILETLMCVIWATVVQYFIFKVKKFIHNAAH